MLWPVPFSYCVKISLSAFLFLAWRSVYSEIMELPFRLTEKWLRSEPLQPVQWQVHLPGQRQRSRAPKMLDQGLSNAARRALVGRKK